MMLLISLNENLQVEEQRGVTAAPEGNEASFCKKGQSPFQPNLYHSTHVNSLIQSLFLAQATF